MTLSRIKTWSAGEILTAADLNTEFNNILSNGGGTLGSPRTAALNFAGFEATNLVLEKLGTDPAVATTGRIYYNTATKKVMLDDGTGIHTVGPITGTTSGAGTGSYVRGLAGTISTNVATFTAFSYLFQTTDGVNSFLMGGPSATQTITCNFQTAGPAAGGRDQLAVFDGTQAHLYAISTGANSTAPACVVSTNSPFGTLGPTLPSSYAGWAYLCSLVYSTGSSAARVPVQRIAGAFTYLVTTSNISAGQGAGVGQPIVTNSTASVETSANVTNYVPTIAPSMVLQHIDSGAILTTGGTVIMDLITEADFATPVHVAHVEMGSGNASESIRNHSDRFLVPNLNSPPGFVYFSNVTLGTPRISLNVVGYTNSNGDQQ